ncbi:dTMP kinase [Bordetella bronchiseptica OSU553]|nr:dTMP kinase [Bordetella bronchiseptica OSU553]
MRKRIRFYFLLLVLVALLGAALAVGGAWTWMHRPVALKSDRIDFVVDPGSTPRAIARTLNQAGVAVWEPGFVWMARLSELDKQIKAGGYQAINGDSPWQLLQRLARGDMSQRQITFLEGWTFRQMRQALREHPDVKQTLGETSDEALMERLGSTVTHPEGMFFPDTYVFTPGSTDFDILRRAYQEGQRILESTWAKRQDGPAGGHALRSADPGVHRREGDRPRAGARARGRGVRQPPAHRHAAADRPDRDLRHGRGLPGPYPQARSADRHAMEHLHPSGPAAHAHRRARARRAAGGGAARTPQIPVLRVARQRHQRVLGQPERPQPQCVALHIGTRATATRIAAMTPRGRFITLEGVDGAGKSTHTAWMVQALRDLGLTVLATREPGGTPVGEKLRELLLSEPMALETETLLMFAARCEHVREVIAPALARGEWVVCDRFTDASYAYQGGGRQLGAARVAALEQWVHPDLQPDRTWLFDVPLDVARARLARSRQLDRFEREEDAFFERTRAAYHERARSSDGRIRIIDSSRPLEVVRAQLDSEVRELVAQAA